MLYKIFLPPKEFGGKCICFVILRDLSIAYLAYVSKERGNATKYCEVYRPRGAAPELFTLLVKNVEMQARQEGRGFADGNLLCVNEQGKTQARRRIATHTCVFIRFSKQPQDPSSPPPLQGSSR